MNAVTERPADALLGASLRQPPCNIAAEQALLGGLLANNKTFDRVGDFLLPDHFADPVNGRIFAAIKRRVEANQIADVVTLKAEFEHAGTLDEVGGTRYLAQLLSAMVGLLNVAEYGRAIVDAWHRREMIDVGMRLVNRAFGADDPGADAAQVHEAVETELYALAERRSVSSKPVTLADAAEQAMIKAEAAAKAPRGLVGVPSGLQALDDHLGGFRPGAFYLLGARPSMGKTSLAQRIATGAAEAGRHVLFVSMEMPPADLAARWIAGTARLPGDAATRGRVQERDSLGRFVWRDLSNDEWSSMVQARQSFGKLPIEIEELPARSMSSLRSLARRYARRGKLDLLIVDYLGLMRVPGLAERGQRVNELTILSQEAKALALDLKIPLLMLAQLNRGVEGRDDKRPGLSDLRDSGSLEQDADAVMFLYRDHYYLTRHPVARRAGEADEKFADREAQWMADCTRSNGRAEVIFSKFRNGRVGTVPLAFRNESGWFDDLPDEVM